MDVFPVRTSERHQFVDVTSKVQTCIDDAQFKDGFVCVFVPHTTAGVTINENADPDVVHDLLNTLSGLIPERAGYRHVEGNSDSHVKASLMGPSVTIPVTGGQMVLGTWQGIFFCEFDGPRSRRLHVTIVGE